MPELPEVESVRRSLSRVLPKGAKWTGVLLRRKDLRVPFPKNLKKELVGSEVLGLERRGKFLIFKRKERDLISHLGMSGTWRVLKEKEKFLSHDHIIFEFSHGLRLAYNDPRRFGLVEWGGAESPWLNRLGPEPLSHHFSGEYLYRSLRNRKSSVKALLMNPQIVVGVGNIYASEILFLVGLRPTRLGSKVSKQQADQLVLATKQVLRKAIRAKGSTLKDYKMVNGQSGGFQNQFRVYGREGEPCYSCGKQIHCQVLAQRSTFWCSQCQS